MSSIVVASSKGSPGSTTMAVAVASWWPRPVTLIEADPAGGDAAARFGLPEDPGLVGLAAALRRKHHGREPVQCSIADFAQQTPAGISVVPAPAGSHQATSALRVLCDSPLPPCPMDLFLDVGRLSNPAEGAQSVGPPPGWMAGDSTDLMLWICRPHLADLAHLAESLRSFRTDDCRQGVVLCGNGPYPADEVATTLGLPVLGHLPSDSSGATAIWRGGGRAWTRSALGRATKGLAGHLISVLDGTDDTANRPVVRPSADESELNHEECLMPRSIAELK